MTASRSKTWAQSANGLMANELAQHSINVNAIAPGYMATENTEQLCADPERNKGLSNSTIARRFSVSVPTVAHWRKRYRVHGQAGLYGEQRPGATAQPCRRACSRPAQQGAAIAAQARDLLDGPRCCDGDRPPQEHSASILPVVWIAAAPE